MRIGREHCVEVFRLSLLDPIDQMVKVKQRTKMGKGVDLTKAVQEYDFEYARHLDTEEEYMSMPVDFIEGHFSGLVLSCWYR